MHRDDEIARLIRTRLEKPRPVLVEGVAILKLLERLKLAPHFLIYVRHAGQFGGDSLAGELSEYDKSFTPEANADIVVTLDHGDN